MTDVHAIYRKKLYVMSIISDVIVIVIILFDYYIMVQRLQRTHDHIDFINYINCNIVYIILFSSIVIRHTSHKPLVVYNTTV